MKVTEAVRHLKGWGYEDWIVNKDEYCGKVLVFEQGKKCSLHYHLLKDETFYLESGEVEILLRDKFGNDHYMILQPGDVMHIPRGQMHQITGSAPGVSRLFEFSTRHFESDSYRVERGD